MARLAGERFSIDLDDLVAGVRLLAGLPSFLRHPITPRQARSILERRFERRVDDFLTLARVAIFQRPQSPHRQLLRLAGCEYGDLERLVRHEGLEGALHVLYRQGVYLTIEEFKGRRPAVRGSSTIRVDPRQLRGLRGGPGWVTQSSGSRGRPTPVTIDLRFVRDRAVTTGLYIDAIGGRCWSHAVWGMAGGWATVRVLEFGAFGAPPVRWFSPIDPFASSINPRYRLVTQALRLAGLIARVPLPRPELVPLDRPERISAWMHRVLRDGGTPHLITTASCAVGVARAALSAGSTLQGGHFTMPGEPITAARQAIIRESGAEALACYAATETGPISYGCLAPHHPDDAHLLHDFQALIQAGSGPLPTRALLLTSLRTTVPQILLNVSLGDQAELVQRECGCPLERFGWTTHLHSIRSFEKLTAEGVTFLDADVIRVLEETLPRHFGGGPTDFQLVEETEGERSIILLLIHPRLGELDTQAVAEVFLDALSASSASGGIWARLWHQVGLPRVERRPPHATPSGKIHHLHREYPTVATP